VIGPQDTEYHGKGNAFDSEMGIMAVGTDALPIANIAIRNCHISNLGDQGIALIDVGSPTIPGNFTITGNTVTDIKFGGITVNSSTQGTIGL